MPSGHYVEPDLKIRIRLDDSSLLFEVTARDPALQLNEKMFKPVHLQAAPQSYFERVYEGISFLAEDVAGRLAALCAELAMELLPEELHRCLWNLVGRAVTLWICSDELWIPWEILKLRGCAGDRWIPGPYLCEIFQVTRWQTGHPFRRELPLRRLAVVLGRYPELTALKDERRFLEGLETADRAVTFLEPSRQEVLAAMDGQRFDAWHLASHGTWHESDSGGAEFRLDPGDPEELIRLRDVQHDAPNLCRHQPLIFLNACHLGRGDRGLVHWGGWIAGLVAMEAGAVLGALWPIDDRASVEFVRSFYRAFLAGSSLGEAVWTARRATRTAFPENATWLAFTAFGHPLAVCADSKVSLGSSTCAIPGGATSADAMISAASAQVPGEALRVRGGPVGEGKRGRWARSHRLRWVAGALVLNLLVFAFFVRVRTETRIQLDLPVSRLAFTTGGEKASPLIDSGLALQNLIVSRFAQMEMYPRELTWLAPEGDWRPATERATKVSLVAHDPASQVSIEAAPPSSLPMAGSAMTTDRLWVEPGSRVVLNVASHKRGFDLGIEMAPTESLQVTPHHPFVLTADFVEARGLQPGVARPAAPQTFLRGHLRKDRPIVEIFPGSQNLVISGTISPLAEVPLLHRDLPITAFDLLAQDVDGELRSTLAGEGRLSYPDQLEPARLLGAGDFLVVEHLRDFRLSRLELVPQGGPLRLRFDGVAGEIRSGPRGSARDHRLTLYEKWMRGRIMPSLAAWVTGWIALALALEELWRRVINNKE